MQNESKIFVREKIAFGSQHVIIIYYNLLWINVSMIAFARCLNRTFVFIQYDVWIL